MVSNRQNKDLALTYHKRTHSEKGRDIISIASSLASVYLTVILKISCGLHVYHWCILIIELAHAYPGLGWVAYIELRMHAGRVAQGYGANTPIARHTPYS